MKVKLFGITQEDWNKLLDATRPKEKQVRELSEDQKTDKWILESVENDDNNTCKSEA